MRVLLVSANTERINMPTPPLGAAMVASATRCRGHEVELVDLLGADDPVVAVRNAVAGTAPEVIGISIRNIDNQNMAEPDFLLDKAAEVVDACRAASPASVVLGGAGYSIFPTAALAYLGADFGVAGEGELAFPALLDALEKGAEAALIPGVFTRDGDTDDARMPHAHLDDLPSPYPDLECCLDLSDPELWVPVQTRRGCPFDCTYCSTPQIEGRTPRLRAPRLVLDDLARLADAGATRVHFVDNTFNLPASYALELCRGIAALGRPLSWRCIVYPHQVSDELVEAMAEAGCVEVAIGSESCCDPILASLNKRFSAAEVRRVTARFAAAGIDRMGFLMLGVPGETRASVTESLEVADSLDLSVLKITIGVRIYPNTPLAQQAVAEGVITAADDLLEPCFYLAPAIAGWVDEIVRSREWSTPMLI
jgi:radical SAM superfamily enzyme YgiQ (UPF0313 family)